MSLASKRWNRVSMHNVVLAWLRSERNTHLAPILSAAPDLSNILDHAHLDNPKENRARLRLLYIIRNVFVVEIPPDTKWYEVHSLTDNELGELHVVNYHEWNDPADKNELAKVAARKKTQLQSEPSRWEPPILWGHSKEEPFAIIEGNNRLTAYAASGRSDLNIPVFVGLSSMKCVWHILDNAGPLMQDLITKQ